VDPTSSYCSYLNRLSLDSSVTALFSCLVMKRSTRTHAFHLMRIGQPDPRFAAASLASTKHLKSNRCCRSLSSLCRPWFYAPPLDANRLRFFWNLTTILFCFVIIVCKKYGQLKTVNNSTTVFPSRPVITVCISWHGARIRTQRSHTPTPARPTCIPRPCQCHKVTCVSDGTGQWP
jgi:hypothetical protein